MIEAKNVYKTYSNVNKELTVLRGIDLKIDKARFMAFVGPSGAGKSTLLHILGGLDAPTEGAVFIAGQDIYSLSDQELSRIRNKKIGFVFQFYHLLSEFTVLENVLIPALIENPDSKGKKILKEKAMGLLAQVGLSERVSHFPSQLSGGEKQRAAIVRALINEPEVLFCDEPTGNLDSRTGDEIISLIKDISRKNAMTVVLVTHNAEIARSADGIYRLRDGLLVN
jgi:lipoprotein-releasing system ATP-binding protein